MPRHDPIPPNLERSAQAWVRYKALMSWMVAAAVIAVAAALLYLKLTGAFLNVHMVIATIAGVFFTVLLGTALMGLAYFSSHSGHDDDAGHSYEDDHDIR